MQSIHIDSETLGGVALLNGWVINQLALAAQCGQLPQSTGITVTLRAARCSVSLCKHIDVVFNWNIKLNRVNTINTMAAGGCISELMLQHKCRNELINVVVFFKLKWSLPFCSSSCINT